MKAATATILQAKFEELLGELEDAVVAELKESSGALSTTEPSGEHDIESAAGGPVAGLDVLVNDRKRNSC